MILKSTKKKPSKPIPESRKLNLVFLEMQGGNAEETLSKLFDLTKAEQKKGEGGTPYFEFPNMKVWLEQEPKNNPAAEKKLLQKLKSRKSNGCHWCDLVVAIQPMDADCIVESTVFLATKVVPALGRKAAERLIAGYHANSVHLPEENIDALAENWPELKGAVGEELLILENSYQESLKELTGKKLSVVAYAPGKLILNHPKDTHCLGFPYNMQRLYEAMVVQLAPWKEDWFVTQTNRAKEIWHSYYDKAVR